MLDILSKSNPSSFFYCPKPNNKEKNAGLRDMPKIRRDADKNSERAMSKKTVQPQHNPHPTVKPITLLRYLSRLITPSKGAILDCFMGSASSGIAAYLEHFRFVGIEIEKAYFDAAIKRVQYFVDHNKAA